MAKGPGWRLESVNGANCFRFSTEDAPLLVFSARTGEPAPPPSIGRAAIRDALGLSMLATLRQVHSDVVVEVSDTEFVSDAVEGDGLITTLPDAGLGIRVADCLPAYIWEADRRGIGIAHCGWRGTAAGIAAGLAQALACRTAVTLRRLRFALGPCICRECYEVGPEVAERFADLPAAVQPGPGPDRFRLDLRAAVRAQLLELGLQESPGLELCTRENPAVCFSHRRDGTAGRNIAVIARRRQSARD